MRELIGQYGNFLLAILGGSLGIGLAILVFRLLQPVMADVVTNLML